LLQTAWRSLHLNRAQYRTNRLQNYARATSLTSPNAFTHRQNRIEPYMQQADADGQIAAAKAREPNTIASNYTSPYAFRQSTQRLVPFYSHFQLRHLLHACNAHTIHSMSIDNSIARYHALSGRIDRIYTFSDETMICSLATMGDALLLAGGMRGELYVVNTRTGVAGLVSKFACIY
jgi:hypothetical protein